MRRTIFAVQRASFSSNKSTKLPTPLDEPSSGLGLSTAVLMGGLFATGYFVGTSIGVLPNYDALKRQVGLAKDVQLDVRSKVFFDIGINGQDAGRVVIGLYDDVQPKTVANFIALCKGDKTSAHGQPLAYENSRFHRIIPNFMIQGGDFTAGDGTGGLSIYGSRFADEDLSVPHGGPGTLSMANAGPNTNGSQFFICTAATPWLDGKHVVFGKVLDGMDIIDKVESYGSTPSGRPSADVRIKRCGVVDDASPDDEAAVVIEAGAGAAAQTPEEAMQERLETLREVEVEFKTKQAAIDPTLFKQMLQDIATEKFRLKTLLKQKKDK
ncbi:Aste57867_9480 [Aphanomyces stellatus]|uniref:peptidylprolyl isomerase n=1 Tax=Aphanomyces stellatus TaxID=120398 RepID=A0A485KNF5_9STRA|nr:hypothetical protein As57867_009443 [Aphanomyces stellatus]VFT86359.1 Aste57867_9480 [Aphanomyces stellatus]